MAVLVVLVDPLNISEEGVDGGDDPAIFGLEDLRQIALAAEDRLRPCAMKLLAILVGLVLQNERGMCRENYGDTWVVSLRSRLHKRVAH